MGIRVISDDLVYFQAKKDGVYRIYQWHSGKVSEYADLDGNDMYILEIFDKKPILCAFSNSGGDKILGDERLNVVVDE